MLVDDAQVRRPPAAATGPRGPRRAPRPVRWLVRKLVALVKLTLFLCLVATGLALVAGAAAGVALSALADVQLGKDDVAPLEAAARIHTSQPTVVLAADGTVLGRFKPEELHSPLREQEVSDTVKQAVVAAEDEDFWRHGGFDVQAAARALVANVRDRAVTQGGSTITQQLVKNVYTGSDQTVRRKLDELRTAITLEARHSKGEILTAYLNTAYFGEGAFGIEAAARTYLRKSAGELNLSEAALLVGLIPAPSRYNPRAAPEMAERRRLLVLDRVAESGAAPPAAVEAARAQPPQVHPPAPAVEAHEYFLDYVRRFLLDVRGYDPALVFRGGLRVETTLEPQLARAVEAAVAAHLPAGGDPSAAVVVLDPNSGFVRALAGGRDWKSSQVNLALGRLGGGTGRQPGSAFKPFVLAAALEAGVRPGDVHPAPAEYVPAGARKPVRNYDRRDHGVLTVAEATHASVNTVYAQLVERVGPPAVASLSSRLGVTSLPEPRRVGPSIALGAYEVSPLEITAAYGAFATEGLKVEPVPIARVLDGEGRVLEDNTAALPRPRVLEPDVARAVNVTLQGVVERGTGTRAAIARPAAGKTGTADDYGNAWFVGYTPDAVGGVWVGHPQGNVPMHGVAGFASVTGGTVPALIWRDVMLAATASLPPRGFAPPASLPPSDFAASAAPPTASEQPRAAAPAATTPAPPPPGAREGRERPRDPPGRGRAKGRRDDG